MIIAQGKEENDRPKWISLMGLEIKSKTIRGRASGLNSCKYRKQQFYRMQINAYHFRPGLDSAF